MIFNKGVPLGTVFKMKTFAYDFPRSAKEKQAEGILNHTTELTPSCFSIEILWYPLIPSARKCHDWF